MSGRSRRRRVRTARRWRRVRASLRHSKITLPADAYTSLLPEADMAPAEALPTWCLVPVRPPPQRLLPGRPLTHRSHTRAGTTKHPDRLKPIEALLSRSQGVSPACQQSAVWVSQARRVLRGSRARLDRRGRPGLRDQLARRGIPARTVSARPEYPVRAARTEPTARRGRPDRRANPAQPALRASRDRGGGRRGRADLSRRIQPPAAAWRP